MNELKVINSLNAALTMLSSKDLTVTSDHVETMSDLKAVIRSILMSEIVLVTPDRVLPIGVQIPKKDNETPDSTEDK